MCGVIGWVVERSRADLGRVASELLKTLEYRGYDSTGGLIQDGEQLTLLKGVGAPSVMVNELDIVSRRGQLFCGQVRWATFGAVTEANSQPHLVHCKTTIYGAHNGNVTNCDDLKAWLLSEGHRVLSDNDGEMVVHTIEHFFAVEIEKRAAATQSVSSIRRACMREAVMRAQEKLQGSFAAVVADPVTRCMWAIKAGSSLYFGFGRDDVGGAFAIASSDLSSVLKLTRVLVALREGEFVEFDAQGHTLYASRGEMRGQPIAREPTRSRLRAVDTALVAPFEYFMDQEIAAQESTCRQVISLFRGGSAFLLQSREALSACEPVLQALMAPIDALLALQSDDEIARAFRALSQREEVDQLFAALPAEPRARCESASPGVIADGLASNEAGFLGDLLGAAPSSRDRLLVQCIDAILERGECADFEASIERFLDMAIECLSRRGRIYVVCCGSSYHAAKAATVFFNEIACTELIPVLPGEFRGQSSRSLRDGDLFVAVSQSGETKDLIDVIDAVMHSGRQIHRVSLVNNVNSTLAQEKSDVVIPLRCGPEVAVPATKSFMNQLTVFYCLALRLAERRLQTPDLPDDVRPSMRAEVSSRTGRLEALPNLIREAIVATEGEVARAAEALYLAPSMHVLATRITAVAKEGALKIREVVLNHTEGFEGSEFKHGPNTILGFNTVFGPEALERVLETVAHTIGRVATRAAEMSVPPQKAKVLLQLAAAGMLRSPDPTPDFSAAEREILDQSLNRDALAETLRSDYPLIYVTGPDARDVNLTVSAINTHKIRGASTIVIAEEHASLRGAASRAPENNEHYAWAYIPLPRTNDSLMVLFTSTVVLQKLALRMSVLKKRYLDALGIRDHGVHPDVPKNVSKSITVD